MARGALLMPARVKPWLPPPPSSRYSQPDTYGLLHDSESPPSPLFATLSSAAMALMCCCGGQNRGLAARSGGDDPWRGAKARLGGALSGDVGEEANDGR